MYKNTVVTFMLSSLVESGRMEIVTGGWVMPDEANSHYFALVDQLIEGHEVRLFPSFCFFFCATLVVVLAYMCNQWLRSTLGAKPKSGWSIDPFGQSPTMAYILKRAGLSGMVTWIGFFCFFRCYTCSVVTLASGDPACSL